VMLRLRDMNTKAAVDMQRVLVVAIELGPRFRGLMASNILQSVGGSRQSISYRIKATELPRITRQALIETCAETGTSLPEWAKE
jgi:hypothetical protein